MSARRSAAWDRVRQRLAARASEWEVIRAAERAAAEKVEAERQVRVDRAMDCLVAYVEGNLERATLDARGEAFWLKLPPAPFPYEQGDMPHVDAEVERTLGGTLHTKADGMWMSLPRVVPPVIREPYLYEEGFVKEGTALSHVWTFIGCDERRGLAEVQEFAPSTAAKGKEILWLVRGAGSHLGRLLAVFQIIREGRVGAQAVLAAVKDGLIPEEALRWTEADWGQWACHSLLMDTFDEPFMMYSCDG